MAKVGLDGHTTGAAVVTRGLRDAGFEVLNLGTRLRPEDVAVAAVQEDVDVVGISILSGAHEFLTREVLRCLADVGADAALVVGGTIPRSDADALIADGAAAVFGPGASMTDIVATVGALVDRRQARNVST